MLSSVVPYLLRSEVESVSDLTWWGCLSLAVVPSVLEEFPFLTKATSTVKQSSFGMSLAPAGSDPSAGLRAPHTKMC